MLMVDEEQDGQPVLVVDKSETRMDLGRVRARARRLLE